MKQLSVGTYTSPKIYFINERNRATTKFGYLMLQLVQEKYNFNHLNLFCIRA